MSGIDHRPDEDPTVLVLTPVKQAASHLPTYFDLLARLDYPRTRLSLGLLEGDSTDDTYAHLTARLDELEIPVLFVGTGEKASDLSEFDAEAFVRALFKTSG